MKSIAVIGSQWGDEGKGKITDILAKNADLVVRYQGGNNAGHTVVVDDTTYKFHLVPSGVIYGKKCLIANGVVLDPRVLVKEIKDLKKAGIEADLMIDPLTTIIMPYHNVLDGIQEAALKDKKIGTTKRGIGPAYGDRYGRTAIRFIDLLDPDLFRKKLDKNFSEKKAIVEKLYGLDFDLDADEIYEKYCALADFLRKYLGDVSLAVREDGKKVLFEGAQGTFLDIAYGTYPYVTCSHPISGGIFTGVGMPPQELDVVGIVKAYTTRVGEGPFLTELHDETGELIRKNGAEFGTTTGRPRRCGWLDLVMLRYSHRLNGFTKLAITKLDVLSGLDKVKVAVKYIKNGKEIDYPLTIEQLEDCTVEYREFEGFEMPENPSYDDLSDNTKKYLKFIEDFIGVPIKFISVGPKRSQTITDVP